MPIPHPLAYLMLYQLKPLRLVPFSAPQIDFLRYNLIVSDRRIRVTSRTRRVGSQSAGTEPDASK